MGNELSKKEHAGGTVEPASNLYGLQILHEPRTTTASNNVDLIFVHGLGGSAKGTWTHPATQGFWPTWLHETEEFKNVRISTFGYNANYRNIFGQRNALGIDDFSKQLLDALHLHYERNGYVVSCKTCC